LVLELLADFQIQHWLTECLSSSVGGHRAMKSFLSLIAGFALLALLAACGGGGGGGGGNNPPPASSSNWDQLIWDQGNWL
jgi:hypothetical protein